MDLKDSKEMWNKLKNICIKVGQRIIYSIFQKLLHYPKITKPKRYKKPVMQIFTEVKYFYKSFCPIMTPRQGLWDIIMIVIILDSLQKNFDTIIASLSEINDKIIDQIQSIFKSKKAKNLSK